MTNHPSQAPDPPAAAQTCFSHRASSRGRRTGAWIARTRIGYVTLLEDSGIGFGDAVDALIWPNKTALRRALKGAIPRGESYKIEQATAAGSIGADEEHMPRRRT